MYVIQCTADRLPECRAGEYLAFRSATQESWAENIDFAQRFESAAAAREAVSQPEHEACVKA